MTNDQPFMVDMSHSRRALAGMVELQDLPEELQDFPSDQGRWLVETHRYVASLAALRGVPLTAEFRAQVVAEVLAGDHDAFLVPPRNAPTGKGDA